MRFEPKAEVNKLVYAVGNTSVYRYRMPAIDANMFVLIEGDEALIVDTHVSADALAMLEGRGVKRALVLLTHEHFDHISGVNLLRKHLDTRVLCSAPCAEMIGDTGKNMAKLWEVMLMSKTPEQQREGMALEDSDYVCSADETYEGEISFDWHGHTVRMKEAYGHSQGGSLIFLDGNILFSGDNLVEGTGIIYRMPGGNKRVYMEETRPLLDALPDDTFVFPGHGEPGLLAGLRRYCNPFGSKEAKAPEGGGDRA